MMGLRGMRILGGLILMGRRNVGEGMEGAFRRLLLKTLTNENIGRTISFLNILHRLIFLSLLYLPAQLPYLPGIAL
jgi:hypothetical protein